MNDLDGWLVNAETGEMTHLKRKPWLAVCGYYYFDTRLDGKKKKRLVHRAVWEAVHGPIPDGLCINHINGDKTDNRPANLEAVTLRRNNEHAREAGLNDTRGERARAAKLTEAQVREIAIATGTQADVAARFGVTRGAVKEIWAGRTWRHLGLPVRPRRAHSGQGQGKALTASAVLQARFRASDGESVGSIARDFGVSASTLAKAVSGYSWARLPGAVR